MKVSNRITQTVGWITILILIVSFISIANAQELTPNSIELYEGDNDTVSLNIGVVEGIQNLVAADFTVQFPANFNIDIQPGDLLAGLTPSDYLLQINQNTPEVGSTTVAIVLTDGSLPTLTPTEIHW